MKTAAKQIALAGLLICLGSSFAFGTDSAEMLAAFEAMYEPELDTSTTCVIDSLDLTHKDLVLSFRGGRLAFFKPIVIDGEEKIFGAYYDGSYYGEAERMRFNPPVKMEREQLNRFFGVDSLDRSFHNVIMLFSSEMHETILSACRPTEHAFNEDEHKDARSLYKLLTRDDNRYHMYEALNNIVHSTQRPFLLLALEPEKSEPVFYVFNPDHREEVGLLKEYSQAAGSFVETICRYSQYADTTYYNINGLNKDRILVDRYIINANINSGMDFSAEAELTFELLIANTRMLTMYLHPELEVDSVLDVDGRQVGFYRYREGEEESSQLYLFFDRPLELNEVCKLRFFYHGDVIRKEMGLCFVKAGAEWYPRYGYDQRALFTLNFKTPREYAFIASGKKVSEESAGDTLVTVWKVLPPAVNVSFNIGRLEKHSYEELDVAPVEIYFSEDFHRELSQETALSTMPVVRNAQDEVADDIINAIRLFAGYFGPYPYERMTVSEILATRGEAFPAFIHLDHSNWVNTDSWGYDRIFRAHEVAHQWWGVGVSPETYHDQWLSEGFSEYGGLMYLQAAAGNDQFLERVREYRNDIFSARQHVFGSGEESGPIALGYRTASTETMGDYGLIIYKKAALVLHMLRNLLLDLKTMKEDAFQTMMREFYSVNRGVSVTTQDFRRVTEKYTGTDMGWFFKQWVYNSDLPTYEFSYDFEPEQGGAYTARCKVITTGVPDDFQMYVPLEIEINNDAKAYVRILIDSPNYEFTLPGLPQRPKRLYLNPFESVLAKVKQ